jgi:DNA-directed RNA polymerase subunit N (RpoN/RPB10)
MMDQLTLFSPIEALTATCTAPYNHRAVGFRNCESAFHLASTILGGCDIIEEFVAAEIWTISYGWAPTEIVSFNVNWAAQEVPFPRFGLQLKEGQSADEFMDETENKVNSMIGESTMNEYKAYKNLVKHKRRINRVFSEICGEKSFCSRRPGLTVKIPAIASYSTAPLKARRGKSSKKGKKNIDETSSSVVHLAKNRSLESTKRKRKSSEVVSDAELQAATSLTQMSRKKTKKAVKKIVAAEVRRVPSAFDDDLFAEPSQKGFFSCLWPNLRFNVRRHCTPGSKN